MINWSDEQLEALDKLKEFIDSGKQVIVLTGFAGTGKSSICSELIKYIESKRLDYRLCAPTHKAKLVLQKFTERDTITLHSLLKLSPRLDILRLDFADLEFRTSGTKEIPYKGVVIVDEASMISDSLYDLLIEYCSELSTKVIFIGDSSQIQPVNNGDLSKVFKNDNIIKLTKIFRQTEVNKLTDLLFELRSTHKEEFDSLDDSVLIYHDINTFLSNVLEDTKKTIETKDLNHSKLICYTNKRINSYNKCIRKLLYSDNEPYHIGELLVGCENYSNSSGEFYNSSDYIVTNIEIDIKHLPEFGDAQGRVLTLYDGESEQSVFMIDPEHVSLSDLGTVIESLRLDAVQAKGKARYYKWNAYYNLVKSFAAPDNIIFQDRVIKPRTFNYGYAISAHKS